MSIEQLEAHLKPIDRRIIPGFPAYSVSADGRCWSRWEHHKIGIEWKELKPVLLRAGYLVLKLCDGAGDSCRKYVHRLVLEAFVGPSPAGQDGCHANGISTDNRLENLRWDTRKANLKDREAHGTVNRGSKNGQAKLTENDVHEIRRLIVEGERTGKIAKMYGVTPPTISDIKAGRKWRSAS